MKEQARPATPSSGGFKLSCADYSFRLVEPWEQALEVIRGLGIEGVDVCLIGESSHLGMAATLSNPSEAARRIGAGLSARGLEPGDLAFLPDPDFESMSGFGTLCPNHPDPDERAMARRLFMAALEIAVAIGTPAMTVLPGIPWDGEAREDSFDRSVEELTALAEIAAQRGVRLGVEAHVGSIIEDPTDAKRMCEQADPLGLTLDYSHFVSRGLPEDVLEPLAEHAVYVHARGAREGRVQAPLRESTIGFERWMDVLAAADYQGFIGFEYVCIDGPNHLNECDTITETAALRDRLRAHWHGGSTTATGV